MAVNKRLRFEVFKRDGFRCTYCGATPADVELHIDHVIPTALGGTDAPENLTTSCSDCNAGKASSSASDETIAAVNEAQAAHEAAKVLAAQNLSTYAEGLDAYEDEVIAIWDHYVPSYRTYAKRPDLMRIADWHDSGVPLSLVEFAIRVAVQSDAAWSGKAAYAGGIIRNKIQEAGEANGA